jgi:putative acetyltransferase
LSFQGNDEEFSRLAEKYSGLESQIYVATDGVELFGCAAFRRIDSEVCEMKRVFVRPGGRGLGLGRRLVTTILESAKRVGYQKICLDVLPEFKAAYVLYVALGFKDHPPVTQNPVPGTHFLGMDLRALEP